MCIRDSYYTDQANMVIRKIDENGLVHTVAGTNPVWDGELNKWISQFGYGGDEGPATSALFNFDHGQLAMPSGRICFDAEDNMYIADTGNRVIRRVDTSGIIHLVAGIPESENSYYVGPRDIAMGPDGNLYIADSEPGYIIMSLPDGYGGRIAGTY